MSLASNETHGGHSLYILYSTPIQGFSNFLSYCNIINALIIVCINGTPLGVIGS